MVELCAHHFSAGMDTEVAGALDCAATADALDDCGTKESMGGEAQKPLLALVSDEVCSLAGMDEFVGTIMWRIPMSTLHLLTAVVLLSRALPAYSADQVPLPLWGHSVVSSWTESRTFQPTDQRGVSHRDILYGTADIYLSAQGHIFGRTRRNISIVETGATRSVSTEDVADADKNNTHWRFDRNILAGDIVNTQGVKRISVTFGSNFKRCSVNIIYGKPQGEPAFIMEGWHHDTYYLRKTTINERHCAIQDGNILAI